MLLINAAFAQGADGRFRVGLYDSPPFVMSDLAGSYNGMAIDLWERIAKDLSLKFDYSAYPTLSDLTNATAQGAVDIAVTNLTITQSRAKLIGFTQPWFDAGLRIMVPKRHFGGLLSLIQGLASAGHLRAYGWLSGIILIATVLLTMFDRRFNPEFPRRWRDGLADGFYTVMSVATSGKTPPRTNFFGWLGRLFSAFWLVCGIGVLAYVTSSVTSVMTTLAITGAINGPGDLPGKTVGVFLGSVAEGFAKNNNIETRPYAGIDAAVAALHAGQVAAILADAPVLEYHAHINPDLDLDVVGPIFAPDKYGFGVQQDSSLTQMLTIKLLAQMSLCFCTDVLPLMTAHQMLYAAPASHGAGLYALPAIRAGASHVFPSSLGFDPAEIMDLSAHHGNLVFFAAPTMVKRLVQAATLQGFTGEGIDTIIYGGGPMYAADIEAALTTLGPRFVQIYGQGECPMAITALPRDLVADRCHPRADQRRASVGFAQAAVEVAIKDAEGRDLPANETGEICVRGSLVMSGYWHNPEATAQAIRDGWLWTGDLGHQDEGGFLYLTDRSKDVIISGGTNIYPREVEEVLLTHSQVLEVSVIGEPDDDWGEVVVACVVAGGTLDAATLDAFCRQVMAGFKRPKRYRFLPELPKNAYGKVLKTELREEI